MNKPQMNPRKELEHALAILSEKHRDLSSFTMLPLDYRESFWKDFHHFSMLAVQCTMNAPEEYAESDEFHRILDAAYEFIELLAVSDLPRPPTMSAEEAFEIAKNLMFQRWLVIVTREMENASEKSPFKSQIVFRLALERKLWEGIARHDLLNRMPTDSKRDLIKKIKDLEYELGPLVFPSQEYSDWEKRYSKEYLAALRNFPEKDTNLLHFIREQEKEVTFIKTLDWEDCKAFSPFFIRRELMLNSNLKLSPEDNFISIGWTILVCRQELIPTEVKKKVKSIFFSLAVKTEF